MAYDENLAERVRQVLKQKRVLFEERRMMGGLAFMVDEKMCVGIDSNKETKRPRMMARVGEEIYEQVLNKEHTSKMSMTSRPMKGFVFIDSMGLDMQEDLEEWVQLCIDYNPKAKKSQKSRKRKRNV